MRSIKLFRCTSLLLLFVFEDIFFTNFITALDDGNFAITCLPKPPLPLTFITAFGENFPLKRTQSSVEVVTTKKTIGQVTGSVLGGDSYKFHKFKFYWNTPTLDCCTSYNDGNFLMSRVIFLNSKYKNVDEASTHPDGIVNVLIPVAANAPIDNPTFSPFEKIFKENIAKPGDQIGVNSGDTFVWFSHFGPSSSYKTFKGAFYDAATAKTSPCSTIIELPSDPFVNFISCKQYANTFGSIKDISGNIINNPLPEIIPLTSPTSQCGITVLYVKPQ